MRPYASHTSPAALPEHDTIDLVRACHIGSLWCGTTFEFFKAQFRLQRRGGRLFALLWRDLLLGLLLLLRHRLGLLAACTTYEQQRDKQRNKGGCLHSVSGAS
jgi:hypothetical protein